MMSDKSIFNIEFMKKFEQAIKFIEKSNAKVEDNSVILLNLDCSVNDYLSAVNFLTSSLRSIFVHKERIKDILCSFNGKDSMLVLPQVGGYSYRINVIEGKISFDIIEGFPKIDGWKSIEDISREQMCDIISVLVHQVNRLSSRVEELSDRPTYSNLSEQFFKG